MSSKSTEEFKSFSSQWCKHLAEEKARADFEAYVRSSVDLIERLQQILDEKTQTALNSKAVDYNCPSWAYRQAHMNGYVAALKDLRMLTDHLEKRRK